MTIYTADKPGPRDVALLAAKGVSLARQISALIQAATVKPGDTIILDAAVKDLAEEIDGLWQQLKVV
jgi:hypothetical protein